MADGYSIFSQPRGPDINVSLFPEAMKTGAAVGNLVKSPLEAIAEGITQGVQSYQNIEMNEEKIKGAELENKRREIEVENLPEKERAQIEAQQAAARHNQALADLQTSKAQEQQQEAALINTVAQALASQDANTVNELLARPEMYKLMWKDPKKFEYLAQSFETIPGVDQEKVAAFSEFSERQKAIAINAKRKEQREGDLEKARVSLEGNPLVDRLTSDLVDKTKKNYSPEDAVSKMTNRPSGEFRVVAGKLVSIPKEEREGLPTPGLLDVFVREKDKNGNDFFYHVGTNVDAKEYAAATKDKALFRIFNDDELKDNLQEISRRRRGGAPVVSPNTYTEPPAKGALTGPVDFNRRPQQETQTKEVFNSFKDAAATGNFNDIEDAITNDAAVKSVIKSAFNVDDKRADNIAPDVATIFKSFKEDEDYGSRSFVLGLISPNKKYTKELHDATLDIAINKAQSDFDLLKKKAESSERTRRELKKYDDVAIKAYQARRQEVLDYYGRRGYNQDWVSYEFLNVQTPADLYYYTHRDKYNSETTATIENLRQRYLRAARSETSTNNVLGQLASKRSSQAQTAEPIAGTQTFNFGAELSGSAHAEELPEPEENAVQLGAEMGKL